MDLADVGPERLFRISREMYEQMIEAGVFGEDDRIQLLEGVLVQMSPQNNPHALTIVRLNKLLVRLIGDRADVATQLPVRASSYSMPEPDLALWPAGATSIPDRLLLAIEVADSTLRLDRRVKVPIYARAEVPESWIVNLQDECIERHTRPDAGRYEHVETLHRGARITLAAFPDLAVAVDDVLPTPALP